MLRFARHSLLFLSLLAVVAVLMIVNGPHQLDVYEIAKIPPPVLSEGIQEANDLAKLKEVCVLLARTVDAASIQRHKDYDDLAGLMRQGLKLALVFCVASAIVLLLGWVAAGRILAKK